MPSMNATLTDRLKLYLESFGFNTADGTAIQIKAINADWPEPEDEIVHPAITIQSGEGAGHLEETSLDANLIEDTYDGEKALVDYGDFITSLEIGVVCGNQIDRDNILEGLEDALNPEIDRCGLYLSLPDYHKIEAEYIFGENIDGESGGLSGAARGEREASFHGEARIPYLKKRNAVVMRVQVKKEFE